MTEERQVLYALVVGGILAVVGVLIVAASSSGFSPAAWSIAMASSWVIVAVYALFNWRRTGRILAAGVGLFLAWTVGTLLTR